MWGMGLRRQGSFQVLQLHSRCYKCIRSLISRAVTVMVVMSVAQAYRGASFVALVAGFPVACCAHVLVDSRCYGRASVA